MGMVGEMAKKDTNMCDGSGGKRPRSIRMADETYRVLQGLSDLQRKPIGYVVHQLVQGPAGLVPITYEDWKEMA